MAEVHKSWKFIGIAILLAILALALLIFSKFVGALIAALSVAYIAYPVAKFLVRGDTRPGWKYLLASFAAILIITVPVLLAMAYTLDYLLKWFIHNFPAIESGKFVADLKTALNTAGLGIVSERIANELGSFVGNFAGKIEAAVINRDFIMGLTEKAIVFFVSTFYFVYEGPQFKRFVDTHITKRTLFLKELLYSFNKICYSLFVSHLFTSIIVTVIGMVGFWIIIRPTLFTIGIIGVLLFIVAFLPLIGPWLIYMPLGLWQLLLVPGGYTKGLAIIVFGIIFLTLIPDLYIRPKLVERGSEIHPLFFIIGFFGGAAVFGIMGVILGPLILGLAQGIVMLYAKKRHILKELIEHF